MARRTPQPPAREYRDSSTRSRCAKFASLFSQMIFLIRRLKPRDPGRDCLGEKRSPCPHGPPTASPDRGYDLIGNLPHSTSTIHELGDDMNNATQRETVTNRIRSFLGATIVVGSAVISFGAHAQARQASAELCEHTTGVCIYTSMDAAPVLGSDVCWDGYDITLAGPRGCDSSSFQYHLRYGIRDASGYIDAYEPVPDTCDLGYCTPGEIGAGPYADGVACCNPKTGTCTAPDANGICAYGDVTWCKKVENNGDGTVTCHE
jgi:hypothetical protein